MHAQGVGRDKEIGDLRCRKKWVLLSCLITVYQILITFKEWKGRFVHICNFFSWRDKFLRKDSAGNGEYAYAEYQTHPCRYTSNSTDFSVISTSSFTILLIFIPDLGVVCQLWMYNMLYLCLSWHSSLSVLQERSAFLH